MECFVTVDEAFSVAAVSAGEAEMSAAAWVAEKVAVAGAPLPAPSEASIAVDEDGVFEGLAGVRGVLELLAVTLGLAPTVSDAVCEAVAVEDDDGDAETLGDGDLEGLRVSEDDGVVVAVAVEVGVDAGVPLAVALGVSGALGLLLAEAPRESAAVGEPDGDALLLLDAESVTVALAVEVGVPLDVRVREGVAEGLDVGELDSEPVADALGVSLAVREALAPRDSDGVIDGVALAVADGDTDGITEALDDADAVPDPVVDGVGVGDDDGVTLPLTLAVALGESEILPVMEAEAPLLTELVGVDESDAAVVPLGDGVNGGVHVAEGVWVTLPVEDALVVEDTEAEPVSEPVAEELAPAVSDEVGLRVIDFERLGIVEGDEEGVADGVAVGQGDAVPVAVRLLERLAESVCEGVAEGLWPKESVFVAVPDRDALSVAELDGEDEGVDVDVCVDEPEGVPDDVTDEVALPVNVTVDVADGVLVGDGVLLADAPRDSVVVGVLVCEEERLGVDERLSHLVGV